MSAPKGVQMNLSPEFLDSYKARLQKLASECNWSSLVGMEREVREVIKTLEVQHGQAAIATVASIAEILAGAFQRVLPTGRKSRKVSAIVISCGRLDTRLTFENFCQARLRWVGIDVVPLSFTASVWIWLEM